MRPSSSKSGHRALTSARNQGLPLIFAVVLFSIFANLLMLTGPLFMLQVYDRVLSSRSEETLTALFLLMTLLYGIFGLLDYARGRVLARIGARMQSLLEGRVFEVALRRRNLGQNPAEVSSGQRQLQALQAAFTSPALLGVLDIPWTPFFLTAIFLFHPALGLLAVLGSLLLIAIALANQLCSRSLVQEANNAAFNAEACVSEALRAGDLVASQGMEGALRGRWLGLQNLAAATALRAGDRVHVAVALGKSFRFFLQSAMLALGALLVLQGALSAGAMIAASILLGRALAPIEQTIGHWSGLQRAVLGWRGLRELLAILPTEKIRTNMPKIEASLSVQNLTVFPPGARNATLSGISFELKPGQALGVIGPSGAGKSTLARALLGIYPPAAGEIRFGGARLEQYPADKLGQMIGYLPQFVPFFSGTIAENIARMDKDPEYGQIIAAAQKAMAHAHILSLPAGYETMLSQDQDVLSGGQRQRVGLARALYRGPQFLVLDEPNSALDLAGSEDLNATIKAQKAEGKCAIIFTHRPMAIAECDLLLVLEAGRMTAFGPRDQVLRERIANFEDIRPALRQGNAS